MADLDEIMSRQGEPAPGDDVETTQQQPGGGQPQPDQQQPQEGAQDDADPVSGLRQALDAERGKGRKYKEELAAVNGRFDALEQQLSGFVRAFQTQAQPQPSQQPQPSADDFFVNPEAFIRNMLQPIQQDTAAQRENFSRMLAAEKHGEEAVNTAYQALASKMRSDPNAAFDHRRIMASPHPYGALVEWHKQQSALSEIGADPQAYRERLRAEILAEMQGGQGAQSPSQTQAQPGAMPTSFAGTRSAGPRTQPQWSGPKPLSELMPR